MSPELFHMWDFLTVGTVQHLVAQLHGNIGSPVFKFFFNYVLILWF